MDSQSKGQGQGSAFASAAFAVDSAGNAGVRDLRSLLLRVPGVVTSDGGVHTRGADAEVAVPATRHRGSALLPQFRVAFVHSPPDGCWATDGVLAGTVRQRSSGSCNGVDGVAPLRWQRERRLGKRFALACRHSHTGHPLLSVGWRSTHRVLWPRCAGRGAVCITRARTAGRPDQAQLR